MDYLRPIIISLSIGIIAFCAAFLYIKVPGPWNTAQRSAIVTEKVEDIAEQPKMKVSVLNERKDRDYFETDIENATEYISFERAIDDLIDLTD